MSITSVSCNDGQIVIGCGGPEPVVIHFSSVSDMLAATGDREIARQTAVDQICAAAGITPDWVHLAVDWDALRFDGLSIFPPPLADEDDA